MYELVYVYTAVVEFTVDTRYEWLNPCLPYKMKKARIVGKGARSEKKIVSGVAFRLCDLGC